MRLNTLNKVGMATLATELMYFADSSLKMSISKLQSIQRSQGTSATLVLDSTVFHPQGGGQPSDIGSILNLRNKNLFKVISATASPYLTYTAFGKNKDGIVHHNGYFLNSDNADWEPGDSVEIRVDEDLRNLHARIHSAGHVIDVAVERLGIKLKPSKAYHFPEGPYVEYIVLSDVGSEMHSKKQWMKNEIEQCCKDLVAANGIVEIRLEAKPGFAEEHTSKRYTFIGTNRSIFMEGVGCFCGGTHVQRLGEIQSMNIRKLDYKSSKSILRICYSVENVKIYMQDTSFVDFENIHAFEGV
ncbi:putative Alanine--tRna ligase [Cardiosporidium cionae]|uniref:Alanine--tRna ligase n=1 Tax=Cardiosporidium cionae TaxID=476202 RepID=A0ABQ7J489_9APIC|nr:putative Alanine--tRna ligase [Cardiosporidium cionae]|eukprot:KAF8817942.1 putative Alanine--tRna ligase [Cardiosporidium cionae]